MKRNNNNLKVSNSIPLKRGIIQLAAGDICRGLIAKNISVAQAVRETGYNKDKINGFLRRGAVGYEARQLAHYLGVEI